VTSEPETEEWIRNYLGKGDVFYDVGAGVGEFALLAAKQGAKVIAFEPMAASYLALVDAARTSEGGIHVLPLPLALSAVMSTQILNLTSTEADETGHSMGLAMVNVRYVTYQHVVAVPLDWVISFLHLAPPTMLKVDVDGTEDHVIQGASITLQLRSLRHAMIETNEIHRQRFVDKTMDEAGFTLTARYEISSQAWNCFYQR